MIGMAFLAMVVPDETLTWGIAGAAAGFLCFNFPGAECSWAMAAPICSAISSGLLLCWMGRGGVCRSWSRCSAIPLLDTVFAFGRRAWRRLPVMKGDAEHIHHQLRALGLSSPVAVLVLHMATFISGAVACVALQVAGGGWTGLVWVILAGGGGVWYRWAAR